jgi:hypothetical protein
MPTVSRCLEWRVGGVEGTVLSEGFKVGVGYTIESSGLKVQGSGLGLRVTTSVFRVKGEGFRA